MVDASVQEVVLVAGSRLADRTDGLLTQRRFSGSLIVPSR